MKRIPSKRMLSFVALFCWTSAMAQPQWTTDTILPTGYATSGIAITPDNSKLVVTVKANPGKVKIINTSNFSVTTIDVSSYGNFPDGVSISPNGSLALVCTANKVLYIDIATGSVVSSFAAPCVGTTLYDIAISGSGLLAFFPDLSPGCTQQGLRSVSALPPPSGSNFTTVSTAGELFAIELSPDGTYALMTGFSNGGVPKVVNLTTGAVQSISGISSSYGAAAFHSNSNALVFDGDSVVKVNIAANSIIKKITSLGYNTSMQSIHISGNDKYAFCIGDFQKKVVDLTNDNVIQTFSSGGTNVAANSDGTKFYVTEYGNGNVRVYHQQAVTGLAKQSNEKRVSVYPNPFSGSLSLLIDPALSALPLRIYDLNGSLVLERTVSQGLTLDLQTLPCGMYFYSIGGERGKIVKE